MIFDFAINQYYPTKDNIAHLNTSHHHNMCILFTSSILLKINLAKKLEANTVSNLISSNTRLASRFLYIKELVEDDGIEPTTPCLQSRCSPS